MSRSPSAKALPLVVLLTFVWGTNWALFPLAVREVSVWTFRSISLIGAGVLLLTIARSRGMSLAIPRSFWPAVTAAAFICLVVWNLASTYAAILIPSGQAAIRASRCLCGRCWSCGSRLERGRAVAWC